MYTSNLHITKGLINAQQTTQRCLMGEETENQGRVVSGETVKNRRLCVNQAQTRSRRETQVFNVLTKKGGRHSSRMRSAPTWGRVWFERGEAPGQRWASKWALIKGSVQLVSAALIFHRVCYDGSLPNSLCLISKTAGLHGLKRAQLFILNSYSLLALPFLSQSLCDSINYQFGAICWCLYWSRS